MLFFKMEPHIFVYVYAYIHICIYVYIFIFVNKKTAYLFNNKANKNILAFCIYKHSCNMYLHIFIEISIYTGFYIYNLCWNHIYS